MTTQIHEVQRALHVLEAPPDGPAWNYATMTAWIGDRPRTPAAVLLAIREGPKPSVVFTLRRNNLPDHPGQVSLPGGSCEPQDAGRLATALRESTEEIGLEAQAVTPLGYLDPLDTISGFVVTPVVALLRRDAKLAAAPAEVERIFEVPLPFLVDAANLRLVTLNIGGDHRLYEYANFSPRIWGVTADIFVNLLVRMGRMSRADALRSHTATTAPVREPAS